MTGEALSRILSLQGRNVVLEMEVSEISPFIETCNSFIMALCKRWLDRKIHRSHKPNGKEGWPRWVLKDVFDQIPFQYIVSFIVMIVSHMVTVVEDKNFDWIIDDELEDCKLCIHNNAMMRT